MHTQTAHIQEADGPACRFSTAHLWKQCFTVRHNWVRTHTETRGKTHAHAERAINSNRHNTTLTTDTVGATGKARKAYKVPEFIWR